MRIAFYLRNNGIQHVDCSNLEFGNPGIGGTHFVMLQVASMLSRNTEYDVYLFVEAMQELPQGLKIVEVPKEEDLPCQLANNKIDIIIANRTTPESFSAKTISILNKVEVSVIVWAHVFMPVSFMDLLAKEPQIKLVIAVSKHQYYTYIDHPIFIKSTYIYNLCNFQDPLPIVEFTERKNDVVYIGAINYIKGVHLLLQQWPKVKKKIPDANLYVIGSGHLYSKSDKLGKFGIAEQYYEKECLKKILKNPNEIDSSVHFLGIMGSEKWEVLSKAKVGIVNTHYWETFGFTAVEMQLAGVPIVSYKSPGLIDTCCSANSILYEKDNQLASSIVKALQLSYYEPQRDIDKVLKKFDSASIMQKWVDTITAIYSRKNVVCDEKDFKFSFVKFQCLNKKIQYYFPFVPSLLLLHELYLEIKKILFNLKQPGKVINKLKNYANK